MGAILPVLFPSNALVSLAPLYAVKQKIIDSVKELYLVVPSQLMEIPAVIDYP